MNILFFSGSYLNYGGIEVVTSVLAKKFVEDGHQVTIAALEMPHPEISSQQIDGVQLVKLSNPILAYRNIRILRMVFQKRDIDVVINQWGMNFMSTLLLRMARGARNVKLVSVLHVAPNHSIAVSKIHNKINRARIDKNYIKIAYNYVKLKAVIFVLQKSLCYVASHSSRFVLLSQGFIKPLVEFAKLESTDNLECIPNPVTLDSTFEVEQISLKKKQLLYVGRMDFSPKRVERIVHLWENLSQFWLDWELVLVGDGLQKKELEEYVASHSVPRVRFEGFKKNPTKNYEEASILLLTSDMEGFGLVIVEGMTYGCVPVVYGSYEAVYDIIEDGKSGYITSMPYNSKEMEDKVNVLMQDEQKRKQMAANAIDQSKKFSLGYVAQMWYNLFEDVLKNGK